MEQGALMPWSQYVFSSMATEVAYDDETQEMTVTWKRGSKTVYEGVPENVARDLANAPSVGQMLNQEIKPFYSFRNI
jgi:hypothetical protein